MSSSDERVELVMAAWRAVDAGDPASALEFLDPEIEVYSAPEVGNPGTFHGHQGYANWVGHWFDAWDEFRQEILSVEPIGERCLLTEVRQRGRGRTAGVEIERTATYAYEIKDGKAVYLGLFPDTETARKAAAERETG
jgi:ketosteroid isomerase-like protein